MPTFGHNQAVACVGFRATIPFYQMGPACSDWLLLVASGSLELWAGSH